MFDCAVSGNSDTMSFFWSIAEETEKVELFHILSSKRGEILALRKTKPLTVKLN